VLLALLALALPLAASANFFDDQGFVSAKVRTDYNPDVSGMFNAGTSANPLVLDTPGNCLWPDGTPNFIFVKHILDSNNEVQGVFCPQSPTVYSAPNFFSLNGGSTSSSFWVLSMNNEDSFDDGSSGPPHQGNSGPPNQSLPRVAPGAGIMGFSVFKLGFGENFFRAHMVVQNMNNPAAYQQIPFMSIGAQNGRGNSSLITTINDSSAPQTLIWTSKVWSVFLPDGSGATNHYLIINARWKRGGSVDPNKIITHQMQLLLFHPGFDASWYDAQTQTFTNHVQESKWNWPSQGSFWYPGADIAFMDAEDANLGCPGVTVPAITVVPSEQAYSLNIGNLLRCASDNGLFSSPMPFTAVPITGIHWANEVTGMGDPKLWVSVHGMRMQ